MKVNCTFSQSKRLECKIHSFFLILAISIFIFAFPCKSLAELDLGVDIPVATITIDGNLDDWAGISPYREDEQGDSTEGAGTDIKAVYLCKDSTYLYWRMDTWSSTFSYIDLNDGPSLFFFESDGDAFLDVRIYFALGYPTGGMVDEVAESKILLSEFNSATFNQVLISYGSSEHYDRIEPDSNISGIDPSDDSPYIVSISPANGASNVSISTGWVEIAFSEPMGDGHSITEISNDVWGLQGIQTSWSDDGTIFSFSRGYSGNLEENTTYSFIFNPDGYEPGFVSQSGYPLTKFEYSFTTSGSSTTEDPLSTFTETWLLTDEDGQRVRFEVIRNEDGQYVSGGMAEGLDGCDFLFCGGGVSDFSVSGGNKVQIIMEAGGDHTHYAVLTGNYYTDNIQSGTYVNTITNTATGEFEHEWTGTFTGVLENSTQNTLNEPLNVDLDTDTVTGISPLEINFVLTISGGAPPYSIEWDFGDGSEELSEENPSHTYGQLGVYTATCTVTDGGGESSSESLTISVNEGIIYEVLTPQFNELSILNGQNVKVFGCNAVCTLNVRSGGNVHCFNFINSNEINIEEESTRFTVHRSGAMVTLENDDIGTFIKIPATLTSQNIFFENSPRILVISSGNVMLGSQVVTTTPEPIK